VARPAHGEPLCINGARAALLAHAGKAACVPQAHVVSKIDCHYIPIAAQFRKGYNPVSILLAMVSPLTLKSPKTEIGMLTRLKVSGFKNLVDVDIRFGSFTCIAGANGVGKSNLFDAIQFLSALADNTLVEAALSIRKSEGGRATDLRALFQRVGPDYGQEMQFEVEMIVPRQGIDDLGQPAEAAITFLRYKLSLAYQPERYLPAVGSLQLLHEQLEHINLSDASNHLSFPHAKKWRSSAVTGRRTSALISTEGRDEETMVKLHQDGSSGSRKFLAKTLPRTVLSTANATESPTALLARREMQSWRLLQLEPSALREPDEFAALPGLSPNGAHLPATLYHLAQTIQQNGGQQSSTWLYEQVAGRLSELIEDVRDLIVDRDEKRQLLTLEISDKTGTFHPARSLSDGTLRFLAMAVLEQDPTAHGLICLEEPENGIHPKRIPAMLRLLEDIAVDVNEPVGPDNPLRQVIVNTHSPVVVSYIKDDNLLVAELRETIKEGRRLQGVRFSWLPDTWRTKAEPDIYPVARGKVQAYLKHVVDFVGQKSRSPYQTGRKKPVRVSERADLQPSLLSLNE
jgi:predicted ATPase